MTFLERFGAALGIPTDVVWRAFGTAVVVVLWLVVGRLSRRVVARAIDDEASRYQMSRVVGYVIALVGLIALAKLWFQGVTGVATYFGLLSAGVAIALQDPLINLAGWLFILIRRPFRVGDRIQVGPSTGDVVDIRPFRFLMLEVGNWVNADQGTGRLLHVPNGHVFKHTVANYDEAFGYIWNELEVTVTFESDWRRAKKTLQAILEEEAETIDVHVRKRIDDAAHTLHIKMPKLTPVVWTSVVDSGVRLTMRYLCKPRARRSSSAHIWERILDAFGPMPNVDFAYPTTRHIVDANRPPPPPPRHESERSHDDRS
jgi:small-conductance mechanosensitive channel